MRSVALWIPGVRALPDRSGLRGLMLSHLIGFAVAVQFLLDRAVTFTLPYNRLVDLPIRLVLVWLILDRVGRQGRMKLTAWDLTNLLFVAIMGAFAVYADLFMVRDSGLIAYFENTLRLLQPYLYFLAVREGLLRKGFRPDIVLYWIVGVVSVACIVALVQALNLGGLRQNIDIFYKQRLAEASMEGPSAPWQARGVTTHANAMAMFLVAGFVSLVALINYRRMGWIEFLAGALFVVTLFATYSRTGIVTFVCLAIGYAGVLVFMKKYAAASAVGVGLVGLLVLFVGLVEAFDIQRYQVFSKGLSVVKNDPNRGMWGWYQRQRVVQRSTRLMEKYPVTGVAAASSALNRQRVIVKNAYTIEGLLLNTYAYAFVSYGLNGLLFIGGVLGTCFYQIKYLRTNRAFAMPAIFAGIGLLVSGFSETTMFTYQVMIPVNIVIALALSNLQRQSNQKPHVMSWLTDRFVRAG